MRAYHGTLTDFDQFALDQPSVSASWTSRLGLFFSESAPIAAHFTLKANVVDAGYDSVRGSRSLLEHPGRFDPEPFLPGARVISVELNLVHPHIMSAVEWTRWVESVHGEKEGEASVIAFRQTLQAAGHDGLKVEAWDGHLPQADDLTPCVETDAPLWVAFSPDTVRIQSSEPAHVHLPPFAPTAPRRRRRPG